MNSDVRTDRLIMKEKAIVYFKENGIPKIVESSLNDLFKVSPDDACGYLSSYFEKLSRDPQLSQIKVYESTGDFGSSAISMRLSYIFRNEEKEVAHITIPNNFTVKGGELMSHDEAKSSDSTIKQCIEIIERDLSALCVGIDPRKDEEVHTILSKDAVMRQTSYEEDLESKKTTEQAKDETKKEDPKTKVTSGKNKKTPVAVAVPDEPAEVVCPELRAHFAVSVAMAVMAGVMESQDLFVGTRNKMDGLGQQQNSLVTLPAVAVISNGKGLSGKCQLIKRCLLVPCGIYGTSSQIGADLRLVCMRLWITAQQKYPSTTVNDRGELVPPFDRPEQFLDIITEVLKESEMEDKMKVILEIGAGGIFDHNKGKYEVIAGQLKSSDEMVLMLKDLVDRYPLIVGLVNPLRKQDVDQWSNLVKAISDRCWIIGRSPQVFPRAQKIAENPQFISESALKASMVGLDIDGYSLYGDYVAAAKQFREMETKLCLWLEDLCGQNWLMDFVCGLQPYFVALPSLRCSSGANKLDRWIELMTQCDSRSVLTFPAIYQEPIEENKIET